MKQKIIADWIIEENKIHKHMIEKSPLQIMQEINSWLWVVAKINSEIVWAMSMIKFRYLIEKWCMKLEVW